MTIAKLYSPVHSLAVIVIIKDLRSQVFGGPAKSSSGFSISNFFFTQPKVGNFNVTIFVKEEIFKLKKKNDQKCKKKKPRILTAIAFSDSFDS